MAAGIHHDLNPSEHLRATAIAARIGVLVAIQTLLKGAQREGLTLHHTRRDDQGRSSRRWKAAIRGMMLGVCAAG